jgi:predicted PurR-regulated permease PerM
MPVRASSLQVIGRAALVVALVVLALWVLWRFLPALAWAGVLGIATWPIRDWLIAKGAKPPGVAISMTLFAGALIVGPLIVLAFRMAEEALLVVHWVRDMRQTGIGVPEWISALPLVGEYITSWWREHLADPKAAGELLSRAEALDLMRWTRNIGSELMNRLVIWDLHCFRCSSCIEMGPQSSSRVGPLETACSVRKQKSWATWPFWPYAPR